MEPTMPASNTPARDYANRSLGTLVTTLQTVGAQLPLAAVEQLHYALAIAYCQGVIEAMGNLGKVRAELPQLGGRPGEALRSPETDESRFGVASVFAVRP
jgi:hypothetical protein